MSKGITNSMEMEEPFYVRRKPDPIPFSKFLYNKEKGTVMGRTGGSWGECIVCNYLFISNLTLFESIEQVAHFNTTTTTTKYRLYVES
jgi:sodium/potassium-transporting ATPase subunit beta